MGANPENKDDCQNYTVNVTLPWGLYSYYTRWGQLRGFLATPKRAKQIFERLQRNGILPPRNREVIVVNNTESGDKKKK